MTPLADVAVDHEAVFFAPTVRSRLLDRLDAAAAHPITLIIAPAGYGKSVALWHWLDRRSAPALRFNMLAEHSTLLGFARGLAAAIAPQSPALPATVATAYQGSSSAPEPGKEMARWMAAHLEGYEGLVAIDDFHRADDPEISRFLAALIARTKPRVRWAIATRSSVELPVATWLAYGDVGFIIGEAELTFRASEALEVSRSAGKDLTEHALESVIAATAGWPVALGLVVRSPEFVPTASTLAMSTREMLFQYLAEQVYADLSPVQRDLLHLAAYLPAIDVAVLESAGYPDAAPTLEAIRKRATFLSSESDGLYKCHDLFREFFCRHLQRTDPERANDLQRRAAAALETTGDIAAALRLYSNVRASEHAMRLLRQYGFDLIDHSHGDVVERVVTALPQTTRTSDPVVLGLRAQREADSGHFDRAEALFNKAISLAADSELAVSLSIRFAVLLRNQGKTIHELLNRLNLDDASDGHKAEIAALRAIESTDSSDENNIAVAIEEARRRSAIADSEEIRAKVLLRLGIASFAANLEETAVVEPLCAAVALAKSATLLSVLARANNVLAMSRLFYNFDVEASLETLHEAIEVAIKSGDVFALQSSLSYEATCYTHLGNDEALRSVFSRLRSISTSDARRTHTGILHAEAILAAWNHDFIGAIGYISRLGSHSYGYYDFDQAANMALHALFSATLGDKATSYALASAAMKKAKSVRSKHLYAEIEIFYAFMFCAISDLYCGRDAKAHAELRAISVPMSCPQFMRTVEVLLSRNDGWRNTLDEALSLCESGPHHGFARLVSASLDCWLEAPSTAPSKLTAAEKTVLSKLSEGMTTKDIAAQSNRSVHTVRTLIQRAIAKLGCSGQLEAVRTAKSLGLL